MSQRVVLHYLPERLRLSVTRHRSPFCKDCGRRKGPNQANDLRCWTCARAKRKERRDKVHASRTEATYGITGELYWALYEFQGGRCAICQRATGRTKRLAVDHDHKCPEGHDPKTGCLKCVRGLLCGVCNEVSGRWRDDPEVGERFAEYHRNPPFQAMGAA